MSSAVDVQNAPAVADRKPTHAADRRPAISQPIIDGLFQLADRAPKVSQQSREEALAIAYLHQLQAWFQSDAKAAQRVHIALDARARRARGKGNVADAGGRSA